VVLATLHKLFMNDQTASTAGEAKEPLKAPVIPTGDELFTKIMGNIEPDLVLAEAQREAKYVGQSDAERSARLKKYNSAIAQYKKEYSEQQAQQKADIRSFGNNFRQGIEMQDQSAEQHDLSALEAQIANF
jgi:hypothetical protein